MTIFDTIRYPLKDILTDGDLDRIPKPIIDSFCRRYSQETILNPKFDLVKAMRKEIEMWEGVSE